MLYLCTWNIQPCTWFPPPCVWIEKKKKIKKSLSYPSALSPGRTEEDMFSSSLYRFGLHGSGRWEAVQPKGGKPPATAGHSMVYHSPSKTLLVYGGHRPTTARYTHPLTGVYRQRSAQRVWNYSLLSSGRQFFISEKEEQSGSESYVFWFLDRRADVCIGASTHIYMYSICFSFLKIFKEVCKIIKYCKQ